MSLAYGSSATTFSVRAQAIIDRIASEDVLWSRTPFYARRCIAGHRAILVVRPEGLVPVELADLTDDEIETAFRTVDVISAERDRVLSGALL